MGEGYLLHQLMASNTSEEDEADGGGRSLLFLSTRRWAKPLLC